MDLTQKSLKKIWDGEKEIENLVKASVLFAKQMEIDAEAEYQRFHRPWRIPKRLDNQPETAAKMTMMTYYSKEFFAVLDSLLVEI